jgi:hypothetical protein
MSDVTINNPSPQPRFRAALDKVRAEMNALTVDEMLQVTIDPLTAVGSARGAYPQIMKLRDQIVALPGFNPNYVDQFETYALATHYTQMLLQAASTPPEQFQELITETATLRETLFNDATALAKRGLISRKPLESLKGPNGFRNIASDVMTLSVVLRSAWPKLVGKTSVTEAELDRAEVLSDQVINDLGLREQAPASIAEVSIDRQKAFTLFMTAYDQLRRAVAYLRWNEGDADSIAPSLYSGRASSKKKTASDINKQTAPTEPITQASPTATTTTPQTTAPATAAKATVGLPGTDPFAC